MLVVGVQIHTQCVFVLGNWTCKYWHGATVLAWGHCTGMGPLYWHGLAVVCSYM